MHTMTYTHGMIVNLLAFLIPKKPKEMLIKYFMNKIFAQNLTNILFELLELRTKM